LEQAEHRDTQLKNTPRHAFDYKKLLFARRHSKPVMQLQRFAAIEKVHIPFDFRISEYLQTAAKFELQNLAQKRH
jgi:hypothetical protein